MGTGWLFLWPSCNLCSVVSQRRFWVLMCLLRLMDLNFPNRVLPGFHTGDSVPRCLYLLVFINILSIFLSIGTWQFHLLSSWTVLGLQSIVSYYDSTDNPAPLACWIVDIHSEIHNYSFVISVFIPSKKMSTQCSNIISVTKHRPGRFLFLIKILKATTL